MKYKKVLITGGAGFIGSNMAKELVARGCEVTVLDSLAKQIHGESPKDSFLFQSLPRAVKFIQGDVTNRGDWLDAIGNNEAIIHLAAETGTGQSMYEIDRYTATNIGGTGIMLDILANTEHSIKKVIVASSRSIYGEGKYICSTHGVVYPLDRAQADMAKGDFFAKCPECGESAEVVATDESSKIQPASLYAITKQTQEQMVLNICNALNIDSLAFRYQNVYGPGQSLSNPYTGILSIFSTRIKNGNSINIFEDGLESRDFVFVKDVVDATILGLNSDVSGLSFNVGNGVPTTVVEVAEGLRDNYGVNVDISVSGDFRMGDIRHNYADLTLIKNLLGFEPKYDFKSGLKLFTDWVSGQEVSEDNYDKSIDDMKKRGLYS